jgi:hypothetical protein
MQQTAPDFNAWEFRPANHPEDLAEREKYYEDLRQRFIEEYRSSEAAKAFFAAYEPKSTEAFLGKYAAAKARAVRYAHFHIKRIEGTREIQFPDDTRRAFNAILQKKLFNLQLQWRAGQIDLRPHVEISDDFIYWCDNIRQCPCLDPVTKDEVETMRAYLQQPFFDYRGFSRERFYQYYNHYMVDGEGGSRTIEEPDWFQYYNLRHGTSALALLPDTRGEIEERYRKAAAQKRKAEAAAQPPAAPYVPPPPYLHAGYKELIAFAAATADPCTEAIFRQQQKEAAERGQAEIASGVPDPEDILVFLRAIKTPPPVPRAGVSWQQAAADVWNAYMGEAVAADLALEWETYELYRATGIRPAAEDENHKMPALRAFRDKEKEREESRKWAVDMILDGREALGEPRDLDIF